MTIVALLILVAWTERNSAEGRAHRFVLIAIASLLSLRLIARFSVTTIEDTLSVFFLTAAGVVAA